MGLLKEFREFTVKGNVMDMAVGIIIGAAFGKIVNSLVSDIMMPPIGLLLGKVDFSSLFVQLSSDPNGIRYHSLVEAQKAGVATFNYGLFINNVINFLIVAMAVFILVKQVNRLKRLQETAPAAPVETKECPECVSKIPVKAKRCPFCTSSV